MDGSRYRDKVGKALERLSFAYVEPRFKNYLLADIAPGDTDNGTLKFFMSCEYVSDTTAFRLDHNELEYTIKQATLLGRIPGAILGHDLKRYYLILPEPDYYSIFGNYPLTEIQDYDPKDNDKLCPRLFWKKITLMIFDKRKRTRSWIGKLRGIKLLIKQRPYVMFSLNDFVKHMEELASDKTINLPHYWRRDR